MSLYDKIFLPRTITLENGKTVQQPVSRMPLIIVLVLICCAVSVKVTGFNFATLAKRGEQFFVILGDMFPPNWKYSSQVWGPLFDTIKMSLLGSFIGTVAAIPFAVLASTNIIRSRVVVSLSRLLFSLVRTLPTLVVALIATYVFGLGTLAGTTAIAVFTFGLVSQLVYEAIEAIDEGPIEAAVSVGANKVQVAFWSVAPQIMSQVAGYTFYALEVNVRASAVLGYVGAGGIGIILNSSLALLQYDRVSVIILLILAVVAAVDGLSEAIRRRLA